MPSEKHTDLIRRSLIWLSNIATARGIRGCAEVPLSEGYVADAVAIAGLQAQWDRKFFGGIYYSKLAQGNDWPLVDDFSFVFEAKASRSDFNKTFVRGEHFGDRMVPRANFHFVVAAKCILPTELSDDIASGCVPGFWGFLEESGTGLRLVKLPEFITQPVTNLHEIGYRILRFTKHGKYSDHDLRQQLQKQSQPERSLFDTPQ